MSDVIHTDTYGPVILEEWLEDRGRFTRYSIDENAHGFDSIWVCNDCECIEGECDNEVYA